jgi:hypothetical protein
MGKVKPAEALETVGLWDVMTLSLVDCTDVSEESSL